MMAEITMPNKLKFTYSMYAVMFGADESLLKIKLYDGFSFVKKSFTRDNLESIFKTDAMGIRRDYETAKIDQNTLDVICAVKEVSIELSVSTVQDYFNEARNNDLISFENQIRAIRFLQECSLRFNKISYRIISEKYMIESTKSRMERFSLLPRCESMGIITLSRSHFDKDLADKINAKLPLITFPFTEKLLTECHVFFDISYHQSYYISVTLLITALEMLYLEKDDGKKEPLAKRCATYLYDDEDDVMDCYRKLLSAYKKRSNFVHEGIFDTIDEKDIIFLRHCVRMSLLGKLSDNKSKKSRISNLKTVITNSGYWTAKTSEQSI